MASTEYHKPIASITLTGEPKSTSHIYQFTCRGRFPTMYMTAQGKALKEDYQWQLKSQYKGKVLTGDIVLSVKLFFSRKGKHDIDNFNKLVLDACSGILFIDDSQIQTLLIEKKYDKTNPRIEVNVYEM